MSAIRDGLIAMGVDVRTGIGQLHAQARRYLTLNDAAHGLLIVVGLWLADGMVDDPLLVWLDAGLVLGVALGAATLGVRRALSTRTAARWRMGQQLLEALARLALARVGVAWFGPPLLDMIRTMPLESLMLGIAVGLVWLLVWPKRACRCHAD